MGTRLKGNLIARGASNERCGRHRRVFNDCACVRSAGLTNYSVYYIRVRTENLTPVRRVNIASELAH